MVKLSYYFPVSSDSVSLKKQLLDSGVLDITNETMYRMAPEAVDPSILSRGSLSYRRYTRSALLMLRDDILSRKEPNCLKDSRISKFSFWKFDKNQKNTDESTSSLSKKSYDQDGNNTNLKQTTKYENENFTATGNGQLNGGVSAIVYDQHTSSHNNTNYSNNYNAIQHGGGDRYQFKYDSRDNRFVDSKFNGKPKSYDNHKSNYQQQRWDPNYYDAKNYDNYHYQNYMMPNFFRQKYDQDSPSAKYDYFDGDSDNFHPNDFRPANTGYYQNENDFYKNNTIQPTYKRKNYINNGYQRNGDGGQRYGSGRITFQNKNPFNKNASDFHYDAPTNHRKYSSQYNNYNDNYHNRFRKDSGSSSIQSATSEPEPEWMNCGPISQNDIIELKGFDDDPASDEDIRKKKLDLFETQQKVDEHAKNSFNINTVEDNLNKHNPNILNVASASVPNPAISINCNDDIQSVCTNTVPSPPPARSTPTKYQQFNANQYNGRSAKIHHNTVAVDTSNVLNYSKKYPMQFSFDNFIDYESLNNVMNDNPNARANSWYKNHHSFTYNNQNQYNDFKRRNHSVTYEKNTFKPMQEPVLKNAIDVKELEDQMRKVEFHKYFPHQNNGNSKQHNKMQHQMNTNNLQINQSNIFTNTKQPIQHQTQPHTLFSQQQQQNSSESPIKASVNAFTQCAYKQMLAQANSIVKQAQDPETFKRFLEQINSMNQLAALTQLSKPLLFQQQLLAANSVLGIGQKRIPTAQELEFHTRTIVQNALFRKQLQEQQKRQLQELQQLTINSNINPNAPEFTPTSVLRKISADKGNIPDSQSVNTDNFSYGNNNTSFNKSKQSSNQNTFNHSQTSQHHNNFQQHQHQHQHQQNQHNSAYYKHQPILSHKLTQVTDNFSNTTATNTNFFNKQSEKHIKWDNNCFQHFPTSNKPPTGRPILKGSNCISKNPSVSNLTNQTIATNLYQNIPNDANRLGFDQFLKSKYSSEFNPANNYNMNAVNNAYNNKNMNYACNNYLNSNFYNDKIIDSSCAANFSSATSEQAWFGYHNSNRKDKMFSQIIEDKKNYPDYNIETNYASTPIEPQSNSKKVENSIEKVTHEMKKVHDKMEKIKEENIIEKNIISVTQSVEDTINETSNQIQIKATEKEKVNVTENKIIPSAITIENIVANTDLKQEISVKDSIEDNVGNVAEKSEEKDNVPNVKSDQIAENAEKDPKYIMADNASIIININDAQDIYLLKTKDEKKCESYETNDEKSSEVKAIPDEIDSEVINMELETMNINDDINNNQKVNKEISINEDKEINMEVDKIILETVAEGEKMPSISEMPELEEEKAKEENLKVMNEIEK